MILSEPRIVFYQGQFLQDAMRSERLTRQELESAMRAEDIKSFNDIEAIVFESDATLSIITKNSKTPPTDAISETLRSLTG